MDGVFSLSNLLVAPFWLLMILLPHWRWTRRIVGLPLIVLGPVALYAAVVLPNLVEILGAVSNPRLGEIGALLGTPAGTVAAWAHFLAFDLFVGRWAYLDSRARGLSAWLMAPTLALILMLGPLGLALYLGVRALDARRSMTGGLATPLATARRLLGRALAINRPLAVVGIGMLGVLAATLVGLALDPRVITGAPAWLKPAKFAISISIYSLTFLWLLTFLDSRGRLARLAATATAGVFVLEMAVIVVQAARGTTSHFNVATPFDSILFSLMGAAIVIVWLMGLLVAVLLLARRLPEPTLAWSLRLALLITLVGMGVGFLMTNPTASQLAAAEAGQALTVAGAHSVGVADGGPGLPIVGWSREAGDLRAPHFVGLHALQVLPLIGWLLGRRANGRGVGHRVALIWIAGLGYLGLVLLLTWQALRGQSIVAPDATTLTAAGILLGTAALAAALVTAHRRLTVGRPAAPEALPRHA